MGTRRYLVSGRVQGVSFRAATRHQARALGLAGHARNLPDGRVEVLAQGREEALGQLESWLWRGPPAARVDFVAASEVESSALHGFEIG